MKKYAFFLIAIILMANSCFAQSERVGGPCEGCEAIYENTIPFDRLIPLVKLPGTTWDGKKPLGINGTVYKADGKTPAEGVIIYLYHTNATGHYPVKQDSKGWEKRHGYLRGWMRTNEKGEYKFATMRPVAYPGGTEPAHIHMIIKEPGINEYYIDDILFSDDPLLTEARKKKLTNRGGSGIIQLLDVGNMYKGERNIVLGKNIPGYPVKK